MNSPSATAAPHTIGRYALFDEIAAGGMATVHLGRLMGPVGFSRTVAIKRLHAHFARDPDFSAGFVDEARLAARIHHPNVVPIIDVLAEDGELSLVMDYVEGDSLAKLLRQAHSLTDPPPLGTVSAVVCGSLYGLHAAHEAVDEKGAAMSIVHRDVSPQNILVGVDGVPRIVDFGVAKAAQRLQTTAEGQVKGKVAYMAPEQIRQAEVSRTTDVYAMGVVLWESITARRLFQSDNPANLMVKVLEEEISPPSAFRSDCPPELDAVVFKALNRDVTKRYQTAREFARDLQNAVPPSAPMDVSDWVNALAMDGLTDRRRLRARVESQDVPDDSSTKEFVSRPNNEELLTVADRYPPLHPDDSTQAVTGLTATQETRSKLRLVAPLILGLCAVAALIFVLLFQSGPELQPTTASDNATLRASDPQPLDTPSPATEQPETSAGSITGDSPTADKNPAVPEDQANEDETEKPKETSPQATKASKPAVRVSAPRKPAAPAPSSCPKFYTDDAGIRRINRKCWK